MLICLLAISTLSFLLLILTLAAAGRQAINQAVSTERLDKLSALILTGLDVLAANGAMQLHNSTQGGHEQ